MQKIIFICMLNMLFSCQGTKNADKVPHKMNGTWVPVSQEMGGKIMPKSAFEKQQLVVSDSNYTFTAESVDKGTLKVNGDKMDIYGREGVNNGKHFTAIYKFEKGQLAICYNLKGDSYPVAFDTKANPLFFLTVYQRKR